APKISRTSDAPEAMPMRTARPVDSAASMALPDTERPLGRFVDRVRPTGGTGGRRPGVDLDHAALDAHRGALQAVGGGPQLMLAGVVVLRAVARALEPLALLAERDPAAQVRALLVQRHEPLAGPGHGPGQAVVDAASLVPVAVVGDEVEPAGAEVEGL